MATLNGIIKTLYRGLRHKTLTGNKVELHANTYITDESDNLKSFLNSPKEIYTNLIIEKQPFKKFDSSLEKIYGDLTIRNCNNLVSLKDIPEITGKLTIENCDNLKDISALENKSFESLIIRGCKELINVDYPSNINIELNLSLKGLKSYYNIQSIIKGNLKINTDKHLDLSNIQEVKRRLILENCTIKELPLKYNRLILRNLQSNNNIINTDNLSYSLKTLHVHGNGEELSYYPPNIDNLVLHNITVNKIINSNISELELRITKLDTINLDYLPKPNRKLYLSPVKEDLIIKGNKNHFKKVPEIIINNEFNKDRNLLEFIGDNCKVIINEFNSLNNKDLKYLKNIKLKRLELLDEKLSYDDVIKIKNKLSLLNVDIEEFTIMIVNENEVDISDVYNIRRNNLNDLGCLKYLIPLK